MKSIDPVYRRTKNLVALFVCIFVLYNLLLIALLGVK